MKSVCTLCAATVAALACAAASAAGPLDQLKGKMKEGLYEYKMTMDMGAVPGMPPGMGKQSHTFQHCVTQKDLDEGSFAKRDRQPKDCEVKDFKLSGNVATYTMECKGEHAMRADNKITFLGDGKFDMDMKMQMNEQGRAMNMTQHMEARYLGACTGK